LTRRSRPEPRKDADQDSDVDLVFNHERGKPGPLDLMEFKQQTARIPGRKAEIMTGRGPHLERVEAAALRVS
jgi:predicted nucleotidyltransferase